MNKQLAAFTEQQRIRVTNVGRLQDFEEKINKLIVGQNADSIALCMRLQEQVKTFCLLECIGKSNVINAEVQSFAQQQHASKCRQARAERKESMLGKVRPAVDLHPAKKQGAPGKPKCCRACGMHRLGTHDSGGCPTHCLKCRKIKGDCRCQVKPLQ